METQTSSNLVFLLLRWARDDETSIETGFERVESLLLCMTRLLQSLCRSSETACVEEVYKAAWCAIQIRAQNFAFPTQALVDSVLAPAPSPLCSILYSERVFQMLEPLVPEALQVMTSVRKYNQLNNLQKFGGLPPPPDDLDGLLMSAVFFLENACTFISHQNMLCPQGTTAAFDSTDMFAKQGDDSTGGSPN